MNCRMKLNLCLTIGAIFLCFGCVKDYGALIGAGKTAAQAAFISENDLKNASASMRAHQDAAARVAPEKSPYTKRLNKIMEKEKSVNGIPLNYKVYITNEVNANASPDGSVRVYSGLMDKMSDDELRFVLGHEIGHVALGHSLNRMRMAYVTDAAHQLGGAFDPTVAALTKSQLGELAKKFVNAQFTQSQESDADKYGMEFLKKNNYDTAAAGSALRKLATGESGGVLEAMFSTHPNPMSRAAEMDKLANTASTEKAK